MARPALRDITNIHLKPPPKKVHWPPDEALFTVEMMTPTSAKKRKHSQAQRTGDSAAAEEKLKAAKEDLQAAEEKLKAAEEKLNAAEEKLKAAEDEFLKRLAKKSVEVALAGLISAQAGLTSAQRLVEHCTNNLIALTQVPGSPASTPYFMSLHAPSTPQTPLPGGPACNMGMLSVPSPMNSVNERWRSQIKTAFYMSAKDMSAVPNDILGAIARLDLSLDALSDPSTVTALPFPSSMPMPKRFRRLEEGGVSYFNFRGRACFKELVNLLSHKAPKHRVFGTKGFGKSHLLAALVVLLLWKLLREDAEETEAPFVPIYIPDSSYLCSDSKWKAALQYFYEDLGNRMKKKLCPLFPTDEDTNDDIAKNFKFLLVGDQMNSIEAAGTAASPQARTEATEDIKKLTDVCARTMFGYSANNDIALQRAVTEDDLLCRQGLSPDEFEEWYKAFWNGLDDSKKEKLLKDNCPKDPHDKLKELKDNADNTLSSCNPGHDIPPNEMKDLLEAFTGRNFLLLHEMTSSMFKEDSNLEVAANTELDRIYVDIDKFYTSVIARSPASIADIARTKVLDNLVQGISGTLVKSIDQEYVDKRYFFIPDNAKYYAPVCGLVIKAVNRFLVDQERITSKVELDHLRAAFSAEKNRVAKGFILESVVRMAVMLEGVGHPTNKDNLIKPTKAVTISCLQDAFGYGQGQDGSIFNGWMLAWFQQLNYPCYDGMLVEYSQGKPTAEILMQVTLQDYVAHRHSTKTLVSSQELGKHCDNITFLWITPLVGKWGAYNPERSTNKKTAKTHTKTFQEAFIVVDETTGKLGARGG